MQKVLSVFGTRPECIKMAPVVRELRRRDSFESVVCVTGQHRQMLDQALELFEIEPDFDLELMTHDQSLDELTARVVEGVGNTLDQTSPDLVLVQGDTTSTFGGALASFYRQIPVGHVEAGLRTGDRFDPWPEEINRKLTGVLGDVHFPPTERAHRNLLDEDVADERIHITGNTVIDALLWTREKVIETPDDELGEFLAQNTEQQPPPKEFVQFLRKRREKDNPLESPLVLITGHRRESHGKGFQEITEGIRQLADEFPDGRFVYPVHLNPNVKEPVTDALDGIENVDIIPPLDYAPFVFLMEQSTLILTDSGGIQEEAPSLGKPVLVMRETTERSEAVDAGVAKLVGANSDAIYRETANLLQNRKRFESMAQARNPFGDGRAAERIVRILDEKTCL